MNIKEYIKSESFKGVLIGISIFVIALMIFQAGVSVGERRASFTHKFGDNFERNFRNPKGGAFMQKDFPGSVNMPSGHGAVGEIISIALPLIIVSGPDNLEKTIIITDSTEIREFRNTINANQLSVGNFVVVLGAPNNEGQIEAKLIRLTPPPLKDMQSSMKIKKIR